VVLVVWFGLLGGFIPYLLPFLSLQNPQKNNTYRSRYDQQKKPFQCSVNKLSRKNPKG
jgi:hypothetical protein